MALWVAVAGPGMRLPGATPADRAEAVRLLEEASSPDVSAEIRRNHARAVLGLLPGHPAVQIEAATLLASVGDRDSAMEILRSFAEAGLVADLDRRRELASLHDLAEWPDLLNRIERNRRPVEAIGRVEMKGASVAFFAEGLGLDGDGGFWVGSYRTGHLVLLDPLGGVQAVFEPPVGHGGLFGMKWDPQRRLLWIGTGWHPVVEGYRDRGEGLAGVVGFDPRSGSWQRELRPPGAARDRLFGDTCLLADGSVVASDATGAALYRWRGGADDALEPWLTEGLLSPQGMAFDGQTGVLFVADYALGILVVRDVAASGRPVLTALGSRIPVCQQGVDGLYAYRDWLIAVQNGVRPMRVVAWRLDPPRREIVEQRVLCANAAGMEEPTLGIVLEDGFWFVANSQWPCWSESGQWKAEVDPVGPTLLRVALPE